MRNLRLTSLLTALLLCLAAASPGAVAQTLSVGGCKAVRDSVNNVWLCSVARSLFGTTWAAVVEGDSLCRVLTVAGQDVRDGAAVTFNDMAGGRLYPFTAMTPVGEFIEGNLTFTWLPVMELSGEFGLEYVEGAVSLHSPDGTGKNDMRAKLKWRGNHTSRADRHKRNYHIKFLDSEGGKKNRSFFGLRKDNHWKLDGGQVDLLRVRNRVCADLWLDMAVPVWYHDTCPEAVNGSRGRLVEVVLNGKYEGIYNMTEPIDRKQLKLVKHDTVANEFHGQMWFAKHWCRTATMSAPVAWSNDSETWDGIQVEYPDFDEVNPTDWGTLVDAVYFIRRTDRADAWEAQADSMDVYFDMPVMRDYFIFIAVLQALDNESKNLFYSNLDKAGHRRLVMTPWDLDMTTGALPLSNYVPELASPERPLNWISHIPMYAMFHCSPRHRADVIERYWELRQTWLHTDSLVNRFARVINELEQCGAAAREEARWSGDTDIKGQTLDLSAELENVTDWIRRRLAYLDTHGFARPVPPAGDVNGDGEVNVADVNSLIDLILVGDSTPNADVNGDGEINVGDINALINLILN